MTLTIDCFKAYDIRGQIPNQLNPDVAYRIGNATADFLGAKKIVLGRDIRPHDGVSRCKLEQWLPCSSSSA